MFGRTGKNNPNFGKPKTRGSGKPSQSIEVTDVLSFALEQGQIFIIQ
jgi:hypothetical protein